MLEIKKNFIPIIFNNFKTWCHEFRKQRMSFRLNILNLELKQNDNIVLNVLVSGIKNQIIQYAPEEIVFNDGLLTEFSPCDVRSITYLSFRRTINYALESPLFIQSQRLERGKTIFIFLNKTNKVSFQRTAIEAYQDFELLNQLNKTDMVNIISTAVQEQTLQDFSNMRQI